MGGHELRTDTMVTDGPARPAGTARTIYSHCLTGDCHLCVRAGCFHRCAGMRKFGLASSSDGVEHDAPKPGGGR